ncbi:hypothetical protein BDV93DRAFT_607952 [Ceratobasidium sp. AG-I]|nr:hypothetical protein BDV93DRAFT_607952 [Ceratobasidium sp. AG-I]
MPKETKQRTRVSSTATTSRQTSSSQPTFSTASSDIKLLQRILRNCHAPKLAETLSTALNGTTLGNIEALKDLMSPLIQAAANPKHCVRCHKTYDDSQNYSEACVILCYEPDHSTGHLPNGDGYTEFECCGKGKLDKDIVTDGEICSKTSHTEDSQQVEYYNSDEPGSEDDEDDELCYDGTNPNIVTSLNGTTPANQQALKELMTPLVHAAANSRHCVKRHKTYDDSQNYDEAYVVFCENPGYLAYHAAGGRGVQEFECCGKEVNEDDLDINGEDVCFRTSHTDDPDDVGYH